MKKTFEITKLNSTEFAKRWHKETQPNSPNPDPLAVILRTIEDPPLACKTVVFESDYVDMDYQDEFCAFYSRAFKNYSSRCEVPPVFWTRC